MVWIAGTTVSSSSAYAAQFNDIPANFTHLQVRTFGRGTVASNIANVLVQLNGDTGGANYSYHAIRGDGASTATSQATSTTYSLLGYEPGASATANVYGSSIIDFLDYTNTSKFKTMRGISGYDSNGNGMVGLYSGLWMSTARVNNIYVYYGNAAAGTRVDLYGITTSQVTGA